MILYELQREDSEGNEEYNVDPAYANRNRHSELILVPNRNSSTINIWLGEREYSWRHSREGRSTVKRRPTTDGEGGNQ